MSIGERLREFGLEKFSSIKEFAKAMKMSPPSLQQYLSDRREPGTPVLQKLIKLGCDVEWLMTGKSKPAEGSGLIREQDLGYEARQGGKGARFDGRVRVALDGKESFDSKGIRPGAAVPFFTDGCFSLEVDGDILVDSEPIAIQPGSICVFEEGRVPKRGDVVAVRLKDSRRLVRVVMKVSTRTMELGAANKYRDYPAVKVKKSEIAETGVLVGKLELAEEMKRRFWLRGE
ncbi:MAG: LexA family transcriptional regulator [Deltaproteobacteria bacterium]|nr:LexA family transcriptional regulator [Deltaproteobacteria bacterium]